MLSRVEEPFLPSSHFGIEDGGESSCSVFLEPQQLLTFSGIKRKAVLKGLGRRGRPRATRVAPAVHGAASAPPPCHSRVQGRGGRCRAGETAWPASGDTLSLGPPFASARADLAVNFHPLSEMSTRRGGKRVHGCVR